MPLPAIRPGEGWRLAWVAAIGFAFYAASALGDDVAEALFLSRVGVDALPARWALNAALDVGAAAVYLRLSHARSPGAVLRVALGIYIAAVVGGRVLLSAFGGDVPAYVLYLGHETARTILVIHWGVFVLHAFDASQARRLFPLLFTAANGARIAAGSALSVLVGHIGAPDVLWVCAVLAAIAIPLSLSRRGAVSEAIAPALPDDHGADVVADDDAAPPDAQATWREAVRSPLVRAIALSTAAMVIVRLGLQLAALDAIQSAFDGDEVMIAAFLGEFTAIASAVSVAIGLFLVPGVLSRFGPRAANIAYAVCTVGAYAALLIAPSLPVAAGAKFVREHFKDALKTPLSALFYGAEPPHLRAPARAVIFGRVIPAATIVASLAFKAATGAVAVASIGLVAAVVFAVACSWQNRAWLARLRGLLAWKLTRAPAPADADVATTRALIAPLDDDDIARGLAASDPRIRAIAEEVLAETIPRADAHRRLARRS